MALETIADRSVQTINTVISKDGKNRLDIEVSLEGLFRYVTYDDEFRNDPDLQTPSEWTHDAVSGLYWSAEAAEDDATAELAWLRE